MDLSSYTERDAHRIINALSDVIALGYVLPQEVCDKVAEYILTERFSEPDEEPNVRELIATVARYLRATK